MLVWFFEVSHVQDVREDLRCSMARDLVTIKNESLRIDKHDSQEPSSLADDINSQSAEYASLDFQKKFTLLKHEKQDDGGTSSLGLNKTFKQLLGKFKRIRESVFWIVSIW